MLFVWTDTEADDLLGSADEVTTGRSIPNDTEGAVHLARIRNYVSTQRSSKMYKDSTDVGCLYA